MAKTSIKVSYGSLDKFQTKVQQFVSFYAEKTRPDQIHLCDGSEEEKNQLVELLLERGTIEKLPKYDNCYRACTSPDDVARVESKTFMCTPEKSMSVPISKDPSKGQLGNWANDVEMRAKLYSILEGSMTGRTMYVLPFCMGPLGSNLAKIGIQITDSPYVVLCMRTMTTMGEKVLQYLDQDQFIKCVHSVAVPLPLAEDASPSLKTWPCNPANTYITQFPLENEIISVGSGYGGNSLLGKKCFALRMACNLARTEGWLAEHMLILGLENDKGEKKYIAAAFPSACGKTNMAMMTPTIPGWKVTCVGDDIAWMKFDEDGILRAVNPEKGFFGVAPGTSYKTNANAMKCIFKDTIFTNVAKTSDGGIFWEGLEGEVDISPESGIKVTDWLGNENWTAASGRKAAHPNSRFCAPISNCTILDEKWDDPKGVPISALIFGGRRPYGVPLVMESFDWNHGVFLGASMKSETTAASSDAKANTVAHDPFAMRPFLGYNAAKYIEHWQHIGEKYPKAPKIFFVNWFLRDEQGGFLWPGFGENTRVLKWIFDRCDGKDVAVPCEIGLIPKLDCFDFSGLPDTASIKPELLFKIDKKFWLEEKDELEAYFDQFLNNDNPTLIKDQLVKLASRLQ